MMVNLLRLSVSRNRPKSC